MSRYDQKQQTEIVRDALNLTCAIQIEKAEIERLKRESFRSRPPVPQPENAPEAPRFQPEYPEKPNVSLSYGDYMRNYFWKNLKEKIRAGKKKILLIGAAAAVLLILIVVIASATGKSGTGGGVVVWLIGALFSAVGFAVFPLIFYTYKKYFEKRRELRELANNDPSYLEARKAAEEEAAKKQREANEKQKKQQAELNARYEAKLKEYHSVTVPAYEAEKARWETRRQNLISVIRGDMETNEEVLQELYDETRLLSSHFRTAEILQWLYDDMSSSDHDLDKAITYLENHRSREMMQEMQEKTAQKIDALGNRMSDGFQGLSDAIESGSEETNQILSKMHRDINIGNAVGAWQRRKIIKKL